MSYLNKLKQEQQARIQYEIEEALLKKLVVDINLLYSDKGTDFLTSLYSFIETQKLQIASPN
jgi:hypothetical protein